MNSRDWAIRIWDLASVESKTRYLMKRGILGASDPESMRQAFVGHLDRVLSGCVDA